MKRIGAFAAVFALFVTGVLVGALATHLFYTQRLMRPGAPPALGARLFSSRLERELELSEEQTLEVRRILESGHRLSQELRYEMMPRVRELMDETARQIETVLDDEQRRRFRELRRHQRRRAEQFLLGPPGPPRGPRGGRGPRDGRGPFRRPPPPP